VKKAAGSIEKKYGIGTTLCVASFAGQAWREKKPVWDLERCFKCAVCWLACPDSAIAQDGQGYYGSLDSRCKGCGICATVCLNEAITMAPEQAKA